ncbi:hypothetical protein [Pseudotabrizicola sp. 4114]|uniref:hypothetical protein n=1 Tax=Pseudotabrizicola sp. 4114 TaxID=2817731 RepID=UPI00285652A6|nr:putative membrane protein YgcG [Pseudorhodobacter sp. 4114]
MRFFDFSSWQGILTTLLGLTLITLIGVGIRVVMMLTLQQRQQRMNRQINERLKTLIAAYKVLGGSFTGQLTVNPAHLRDLRSQPEAEGEPSPDNEAPGMDRARRIRDAVEGALSDILLLGTEEHVRLAGQAARDMVAGRPIHTAELVTSLRTYVRRALDLDPVPPEVEIPSQGPTRPQSGSSGRSGGRSGDTARGTGGGGGGGGAGSGGMGMGMGLGGRRGEDS